MNDFILKLPIWLQIVCGIAFFAVIIAAFVYFAVVRNQVQIVKRGDSDNPYATFYIKTNPKARAFHILRKVVPINHLRRFKNICIRVENRFKYGDQWFPRAIAIEITAHCNRACYYCPQSVQELPVQRMEHVVFIRALQQIAELNWAGVIDYTRFNEPLLEKRLEEYVRLTLQYCPKAIPQIITNGDALTEQRLVSLLQAGVMNFNITRHPPYRAEWDERIQYLAQKYPQVVRWQCIEDTELGNRAGLVTPKYQQNLAKTGCTSPSEGLIIDIDGNYLFCCCDYHRKHVMGNVFYCSIEDAWRDAFYASRRESVRRKQPKLEICHACFKLNAPEKSQ